MGSLAILAPSTPSSENCESMMICMFARRELQGPNSPPTRGSRWMTAGLVQDADLDTDTVARADTKLLLSCQAPRACSHLEGRPFLPPVGRVSKPYYKMQTRGEPPELNYPEASRTR